MKVTNLRKVMTPQEFYEWMENELPVPIRLSTHDATAARLLLWLIKELPENSTQGDLQHVLDAAKWWSTFWAAAFKADTAQKPDKLHWPHKQHLPQK